jgi:hypothetical protein
LVRSTVALGQGLLASSLAQISWVGRSNLSWAGSPKLETGEGAGHGARGGGGGRIWLAGGEGRRGNNSREVPGCQEPFWGSGEEWLTGVALPMATRLGGGGSPVRGRWRGRGRSLCGCRGAPSRGDACGGRDEAGGGPERPTHGGVPGGEEEGGLSGGGDRRLWLGHTSRKSAEWSERCAGPVRSSWRLK